MGFQGFDSKRENADAIVCPHCERVHGNYDDYIEVGDMGGDFTMTCEDEECGKEFNVEFYSVFYFQTSKED